VPSCRPQAQKTQADSPVTSAGVRLPADGPYRRIGGDKAPQPAVQITQICATVTGTRAIGEGMLRRFPTAAPAVQIGGTGATAPQVLNRLP
jgi:hypothetical protein